MTADSGRLVLASSSPRRLELLGLMGVACDVVPSTVDERTIPADHPRTFALRAAYAKAIDVAARVEEGRLVLAADTVVTCRQVLFGKPADKSDARRMVRFLSGRPHHVITAVALACAGRSEVHLDAETTEVIFRHLSEEEIAGYLSRADVLDKAGAYGIQEEGGALVESLEGDYFNVVGLPCALVARLLGEMAPDMAVRVPATPAPWGDRRRS